MQKQIKIEEVSIKKQGTNEKTGKPWTLYLVKVSGDPDMTEFSTFNMDYQNSEGQQMRVNVEYSEKFKNWNEISAKQDAENSKHDELMNAIRQVWDKLDKLEKSLAKYPDQEPNVPEEHLKEGEPEIPIYDEEQ